LTPLVIIQCILRLLVTLIYQRYMDKASNILALWVFEFLRWIHKSLQTGRLHQLFLINLWLFHDKTMLYFLLIFNLSIIDSNPKTNQQTNRQTDKSSESECFFKISCLFFNCFTAILVYLRYECNDFLYKFLWLLLVNEMTWILKVYYIFFRLELCENSWILLLSIRETHKFRMCTDEDSSRTLPKTVFYFIVEHIISGMLECFEVHSPC